jgi:hypothetical protein
MGTERTACPRLRKPINNLIIARPRIEKKTTTKPRGMMVNNIMASNIIPIPKPTVQKHKIAKENSFTA